MNCIDLTSKRSKMFSFVAEHSKLRKTIKVLILQWIASILHQNDLKCSVTSQNIQNYAKLQKWSNYNELHQSDVKTIQTFELGRKTTQVIILQWIASILHQNDLKCSVTSQNIQNYAKLQKWSNHNELHQSDVRTIKTFELRPSTTKVIKLQWITSIWHQINQNVEKRRKTFKTTHNYESDQIIMNCIDLTSKRSKMFSFVAEHSKLRKTIKVLILQWIASILHQNDLKCSVTSQNIQNYAKLQKWSNYNELHQSDVKTIQTFELGRKTTKVIKLQWIASILHQNDLKCSVSSQNIQNYAKL